MLIAGADIPARSKGEAGSAQGEWADGAARSTNSGVYFRKGMRPGRARSEAASNGAHARPTGHIYSRPEVRNLCTGSVASNGSGLRWKIQRATANPTATYIRLRAFITPPIQR